MIKMQYVIIVLFYSVIVYMIVIDDTKGGKK